MRPLQIYIETSVFGFLLDTTEVNRSKREATEQMFNQIREGRLAAHVSSLVFAELEDTPISSTRDALLQIARVIPRLTLPSISELDELVDYYMRHRAFPEDKRDDAAHVAFVVLTPGIDVMVSGNCKHLANKHNYQRLKALTLAEGYPFSFDIGTPEQVIYYG